MSNQSKYVVHDPKGDGWVMKSPIEGWIFTTLKAAATRFSSPGAARSAIETHYRTQEETLEIREVAS